MKLDLSARSAGVMAFLCIVFTQEINQKEKSKIHDGGVADQFQVQAFFTREIVLFQKYVILNSAGTDYFRLNIKVETERYNLLDSVLGTLLRDEAQS